MNPSISSFRKSNFKTFRGKNFRFGWSTMKRCTQGVGVSLLAFLAVLFSTCLAQKRGKSECLALWPCFLLLWSMKGSVVPILASEAAAFSRDRSQGCVPKLEEVLVFPRDWLEPCLPPRLNLAGKVIKNGLTSQKWGNSLLQGAVPAKSWYEIVGMPDYFVGVKFSAGEWAEGNNR